jgi:hypothetical protein
MRDRKEQCRWDLEELSALGMAMDHGDTLSDKYRTRYTPTPKTRYHSQIQQVTGQ